MKRCTALLIILILFGNIGKMDGQSKSNDLGIEGGPGLSIIHDKTGMFSDSRYSIGGISGVFFQDNFNKTFSLRTGINFERKSTNVQSYSDQLPRDGNLLYNFDYLSTCTF